MVQEVILFMSQKQILDTALNFVKRAKFRNSESSKEENEFFELTIENLKNLISLGECNSKTEENITNLIYYMSEFKELGVIIGNKFQRLAPSDAYRHNIRRGNFISGKKFLVITTKDLESIQQGKDITLVFPNSKWDEATESLIHKDFWKKRNA